ncbi:septation protein SepH [Bifidobacterium sp. ESL0745]|uniref:septation protein SepH n=1 Tax=Bifidobacterium sp. ESL0745 TaxID=2983226 RepID=UPI0023F9298C|nr:septation protein SepH [Bifidobacterium sp. ESL0745]MDF7664803.1 septation protein SepH [Bifidobacterium sp. ESL0745]
MPVSSVAQARFDHVDEDGELVFVSRGLKFRVPVDDTLEHAILEARQIKSETDEASNPGLAQTLPISSIQALIRAGAQPEKVAEKYGLSQALVRRFSAPVETEKQYAIEQFLAVSAPKGSKVHSVEELIARTLAAARIGMESVKWSATRRGREPWLITATFRTQRNLVRAEWTWNMHDNTVECQNTVAQILLGERETGQHPNQSGNAQQTITKQNADSVGAKENANQNAIASRQSSSSNDNQDTEDSSFEANLPLPGNSVRSARIATTVASMREQSDNATATRDANTQADQSSQKGEPASSNDGESISLPYPAPITTDEAAAADASSSAPSQTANVPVDALSLPLANRTSSAQSQMFTPFNDTSDQHSENDGSDAPSTDKQQNAAKGDEKEHDGEDHKRGKRKSGRSAVPSWDEILFGE